MLPSSSPISSFFRGLNAISQSIEQWATDAQSQIASGISQIQTTTPQKFVVLLPSEQFVEQSCPEGSIKFVPLEVLVSIFKFANASSLGNSLLVCKEWRQIIEGTPTFQKIVQAGGLIHLFNRDKKSHQEILSNANNAYNLFHQNFMRPDSSDKYTNTYLNPILLEKKQAAERELSQLLITSNGAKAKAQDQKVLLKEKLGFFLEQGRLQSFAELINMIENPQEAKTFYLKRLIGQEDFVTLVKLCPLLDVSLESLAKEISNKFFSSSPRQINSNVDLCAFIIARLEEYLPTLLPEVALVVLNERLNRMIKYLSNNPQMEERLITADEQRQMTKQIFSSIQFFHMIECPCVISTELKIRMKNNTLFQLGNKLMSLNNYTGALQCCTQLEGIDVKIMSLLRTAVNLLKFQKAPRLPPEDLLNISMVFIDCALECLEDTNKLDMLRLMPFKYQDEIYRLLKGNGFVGKAKAFAEKYIPLNYYNDLYFELMEKGQEEEAQALIEQYRFLPIEPKPIEPAEAGATGQNIPAAPPAHGTALFPYHFRVAGPIPFAAHGPFPFGGPGPIPFAAHGPFPFGGPGPIPFAGPGPFPFAAHGPIPFAAHGPFPFAGPGPIPFAARGMQGTIHRDQDGQMNCAQQ